MKVRTLFIYRMRTLLIFNYIHISSLMFFLLIDWRLVFSLNDRNFSRPVYPAQPFFRRIIGVRLIVFGGTISSLWMSSILVTCNIPLYTHSNQNTRYCVVFIWIHKGRYPITIDWTTPIMLWFHLKFLVDSPPLNSFLRLIYLICEFGLFHLSTCMFRGSLACFMDRLHVSWFTCMFHGSFACFVLH